MTLTKKQQIVLERIRKITNYDFVKNSVKLKNNIIIYKSGINNELTRNLINEISPILFQYKIVSRVEMAGAGQIALYI